MARTMSANLQEHIASSGAEPAGRPVAGGGQATALQPAAGNEGEVGHVAMVGIAVAGLGQKRGLGPVRGAGHCNGPDSRLLSRMSHELRSPLNAVIGFSDLMHKEIHGPIGNDRYREYASHILSSGHELLRTAEDALAIAAMVMARVEGIRETVEIEPLLLDARRHVAACGGPGVQLVIEIDEGVAVVAQRRALRQALWNLLKEACRQSAAGGIVRVSAGETGAHVSLRFTVVEAMTPPPAGGYAEGERSLSLSIAESLIGMLGGDLVVLHEGPQWQATMRLEAEIVQDQLVLPIA